MAIGQRYAITVAENHGNHHARATDTRLSVTDCRVPPSSHYLKHLKSSPPISNNLQIFIPESPKSLLYLQSRTGLPACPSERSSDRPGATMSTLRQTQANRRNAQKSTGPTSVTGK